VRIVGDGGDDSVSSKDLGTVVEYEPLSGLVANQDCNQYNTTTDNNTT